MRSRYHQRTQNQRRLTNGKPARQKVRHGGQPRQKVKQAGKRYMQLLLHPTDAHERRDFFTTYVNTRMRQFLISVLIICTLLLAGCKTKYEEIPPKLPETVSILAEVDTTWRFRSMDGNSTQLGHFIGRKIFINIWATWCGPCLVELPHLQTLYDSLRSDTSIAFLFISDEPDTTVRTFVARSNYSLPFYVCDETKPKVFDTGSYPSTFIVNARGEIVYKKLSTANWSHHSVIDFLRRL